ncbi:hypothetical protein [Mycoplasma tauri]|uniref:Uncharacterized protein n=1 Tax=Mycoplasma tauri TaxID=547987 RepID=A0A953NDT5_9MOLU|nr:hypothetical protein [Mycoplasma tauri]MBZ4195128.1 hypothetical protein [Mycoplasma tauri]MBZ4203730.1 hypothetical protein [Mycoplasma tauri]MBZ4204261.1 hypothetical protein [Mycoplasma tauri]MBZ4212403.1 hypothetical protein [Mycoplasma tauri]MBZ4218170.1 hypothetical protein [Mycoplasma tauri]
MKKVNIRSKTICWAFLGIIAIGILIYSSIVVHNSLKILELAKWSDLNPLYLDNANYQMSYAIAGITISIIVVFISSFVTYAGIKSWNYKAVL